jgi:hypothetical protein
MHGPLAAAAILDRGLVGWKGYLAFSRNYDISKKFGKTSPDAAETDVDRMGHVLFVLKLDDVPRGTPWIWYLARGTNEAEMRRARNTAKSGLPEYEVLFPPGRLEFAAEEDAIIARAIRDGIAAAAAPKKIIISKKENSLIVDTSGFSTVREAVKAVTISLIHTPLRKRNVTLEFTKKPAFFARVAHMIQLALLDRGIVDYVIDRRMFRDPLEISVRYVRDAGARSVAYSVPFSKQNGLYLSTR